MKKIRTLQPSGATSDVVPEITDKKGYAARWQSSVRWVDKLLQKGLPHLAIGKRRVRIEIAPADAWMREQFATQRFGRMIGSPPQINGSLQK